MAALRFRGDGIVQRPDQLTQAADDREPFCHHHAPHQGQLLIPEPEFVLAGLFVWLKLTEESDEEALELDQEGV